MSGVPLVYAGRDYWDRTQPLIDGRVRPDGIDLTYLPMTVPELWIRMLQNNEFDAAETAGCSYIVLRARGDGRFIALPVFPSRNFRHGYIYIRSDAGIERPQDLVGKRVGVGEYATTASTWVRAMLQHDYGVLPSAMHWFEGSLSVPGDIGGHAPVKPPGVRLETIPADKTLEGMLLAGELDALISPRVLPAHATGDPRVRRLFPNYREVEKDYYRRTGFFPIMHMVVLRRDVYEQHRWIALSLFKAFEEAKALSWKRLQDTGMLPVRLPWLRADLEELTEVFGGDPFRYGFEANQHVLEAMTQYVVEQGLAERKVDPKELFAPETLAT